MHIKSYNNIKVINPNNLANNFIGKNVLSSGNFTLDMEDALYSIDSPKLFFTNKLKSKKDNYFKFIRKVYKDSLRNELELINDFDIENLTYKNIKNQNRLLDLLNLTHNNKFKSMPIMIKCKHITNRAFQFFIEWVDSDNARVNLIDVHHLVFPTKDAEHNEKYVDKKKKYDNVKDCNVCLSEVKK